MTSNEPTTPRAMPTPVEKMADHQRRVVAVPKDEVAKPKPKKRKKP